MICRDKLHTEARIDNRFTKNRLKPSFIESAELIKMKDALINLTYIAAVVVSLTGVFVALVAFASSGLAVPVDELVAVQATELAQTVREAL